MDTGYCDNAVKISRQADLLIAESSYLPGEENKKWPHLNPDLAVKLADESGAKKLILTHFAADKYNLEKIEIAIRNNGSLINEEFNTIMNDPLFLTENSNICIGINVTRAVIENHGGNLWLTANRHHGMTLRITIPCVEEKTNDTPTNCICG